MRSSPRPVILWLRRDLRLADQPALAAALDAGAPVIPVYVLDDVSPGERRIGGAQRWWLHHSLTALGADLAARGSRLILRRGRASEELARLATELDAEAIHAIAHHERWWVAEEAALAERLQGTDTRLSIVDGNYLAPVGSMRTGAGAPFRIYTPFYRALQTRLAIAEPVPAPAHIPAPARWPASDALAGWGLLPTRPDWSTGFSDWTPGEAGAWARADEWAGRVDGYAVTRNLPSREGISRLSPHLHHGEIAVWRLYDAVGGGPDASVFRQELGWRDFSQNIIAQFPHYEARNAREAFDVFPWRDPAQSDVADDLSAWRAGRTGYPIVDAGMRELWVTGWMHNRVRMITASFLIKHLLIDWRVGERWFWDTLLCADQGSNSTNWQWVAGTGVDSSMFSRIMAPLVQSEKFGAGDYIRRWVPELRGVDDRQIHDPDARTRTRIGYPVQRIGHVEARQRALAAYAAMRARSGDARQDDGQSDDRVAG